MTFIQAILIQLSFNIFESLQCVCEGVCVQGGGAMKPLFKKLFLWF